MPLEDKEVRELGGLGKSVDHDDGQTPMKGEREKLQCCSQNLGQAGSEPEQRLHT